MYYDRGALKRRAKHLVRQGNPAVYMVTLIFFLATTAVSEVVSLLLPNPVNQMSTLYSQWINQIVNSGGQISQGAVDAFYQQMWSLFRGPMASVAMLVALIIGFYSLVVQLGYYGYTLRVMRGQEGGGYGALFSRFDLAGKVILLTVLEAIFIFLWSCLFVIPGIVAAYRYRLSAYALLDDPEISPLEAIRRSKRLMTGHKMELFVTDLSFLGWLILAGIVVSAVYQLALLFLPMTVADLLSLAVNIAISMFLSAYISLTDAGFYLFALGNQAPPVQNQGGYGQWGQQPPQNPYGGDQGWGQQPPQNPYGGDQGWGQQPPQNPYGGDQGWNQQPPQNPDNGDEGWNR